MGGASKQKQQSASIQDASSSGFNISQQQAGQQANSATMLLGEQLPYFQQLWGAGSSALAGDPGIAGAARSGWEQAASGRINPGVADVIANASNEMGLNFSRNTAPAIRRGAVGTGSLGGSRQGIAEGLAAGELARAQAGMATELTARGMDQAGAQRGQALSMSGMMQALPWQGVEAFGRALGGPIMQSFGSSTASSSGGSLGLAESQSHGSGSGSGSGASVNVLGK